MTDTRLYGSAIAIVSGAYSIAVATSGGMGSMATSASVMLIVGVAALLHGAALLTPAADRFMAASGPLMLLWAAAMLGNQALAATMPGWAMQRPMMGSPMAWDGGMVAIALLMLVSGLIMTRRRGMP